jgi:hypothetical protein
VITGAKTDEHPLNELHRQLNIHGFDVVERADTEPRLSGRHEDAVIGIVLMDSPKVSTRGIRMKNRLVPIVVFGSYRSDPPGDVCCTSKSRIAASYLKSECLLREVLTHHVDHLFEEETSASSAA